MQINKNQAAINNADPIQNSPNTNLDKKRDGISKPEWLRVKLPIGKEYAELREIVATHTLHTICESGNCPNMDDPRR